MDKIWYLYILKCKDGTLYTGITDDVEKRFAVHSAGKGAKYTRGRGPFVLCYTEQCTSHSMALQREVQVKRLTRAEKFLLIDNFAQMQRGKDT